MDSRVILVIIASVLFISGCVNITVEHSIKKDSSSDITITYDFSTVMEIYNISKYLSEYCKYYHSDIISGYNCEDKNNQIIIKGFIPKTKGYKNGEYNTKFIIDILNESFPPFTLYNKYRIPNFKSAMERLHDNNAIMVYNVKFPGSDVNLDLYDVYKNEIIVKKNNKIIVKNNLIYQLMLLATIIFVLFVIISKRKYFIRKKKTPYNPQVLILIGWIQKHKKHYSKSHLRKELIKQGYRKRDIDEAFEHVD